MGCAAQGGHAAEHLQLLHEQLGSGLYDIAICDEPEERLDTRFSAEPLYTDHNIFVTRKGHQWTGAGRLDLNSLVDAEWTIVGPFCRLWNELRDIYAWAGLAPPRHSMESNSVELCVQQLLNDDYVSFLPARLVNEELIPARESEGIRFVRRTRWRPAHRDWVLDDFQREIEPVLSPTSLDPARPFPKILNKSLNFIVGHKGMHAFGRPVKYRPSPLRRGRRDLMWKWSVTVTNSAKTKGRR